MTTSESFAPKSVSVAVDNQVCAAGGQCEMLEPEMFSVDDETAIATVTGDGKLSPERAATLVDRCPSGAIYVDG